MISISRARKILGKKYSHLDDDGIESLIQKTYTLAEMAIHLSDKKVVFQSQACIIDSNGKKKDD